MSPLLAHCFRLRKALIALCLAGATPLACATVLNFDDLGSLGFFTANYNGFMFGDNSLATNPWFHTMQPSTFYTPKSGAGYIATDYTLYNNQNAFQATQPISSTTAFKFDGAWFSGGDTIGYQLFNGASLVSTSMPSAVLNSTPQFVASGYTGLITSVVIYGRQGYYALDDFTFNTPAVVTPPVGVPEPEIVALLSIGALAATYAARRRKHAV